MDPIKYVDSESASSALTFERRFRELPASAGVLFVGVYPSKVVGGRSTTFDIHLGITKSLDESVGHALIRQVMAPEIQAGVLRITASVHRGVPGAAV